MDDEFSKPSEIRQQRTPRLTDDRDNTNYHQRKVKSNRNSQSKTFDHRFGNQANNTKKAAAKQRNSNNTASKQSANNNEIQLNRQSNKKRPVDDSQPSRAGKQRKTQVPQRSDNRTLSQNTNNNNTEKTQASRSESKTAHHTFITNGSSSTSRVGVNSPSNVEIGKLTYSDEPPFEFVNQVGQGTYGKVYKAIDRQTSRQLAMKRLRLELNQEGFPITAAREIKSSQMCKHPNIVHLCEIVVSKSEVYMALDYIQNDLAGLSLNKQLVITPAQSKSVIRQVSSGLAFLRGRKVLHRDIKGSNVLVTRTGVVKSADFGLARIVNTEVPNVRYTNRVISSWYRPPESSSGSEHYGYEVDVWSVGCLFVEIFSRTPLFHGKDEVSQIQAIYSIMGSPKDNDWPEHEALPWNPLIESLASSEAVPAYRSHRVFSGPLITEACFDLASKMLAMNPKNRITAEEALTHPYFKEEPLERRLDFADGSEWHDWEAKQRGRQPEDDDELMRKAGGSSGSGKVVST